MTRIVLIGDLQYAAGEEERIRKHMEQINSLKPDFAVFMGDMGCHGKTGSKEGMQACREFFSILDCSVVVLMGNHDVEYRPDDPIVREPETWYRMLFGRDHPWQAWETEEAFILCLTIERQPEETLRTQHALYVSDKQFEWAKAQLESHQDRPTIIFSHAPVAGSGLRCCPPIHSAATDAHLDHAFNALKWRKLMKENPQIRLWCSAHFHMGHDYDTAIVSDKTTVHVSVGVLTSAARDGSRDTRAIDLANGQATVMTLDHWENTLRKDAVVPLSGNIPPQGRMAIRRADEILLGEDHIRAAFAFRDWGRAYVITDGDMLWEYDRELQEITGAICCKRPVHALAIQDKRLYVEMKNGAMFSVDMDDPGRFDRLSGYVSQKVRTEKMLADPKLPAAEYSVRSTREGEYVQLKF